MNLIKYLFYVSAMACVSTTILFSSCSEENIDNSGTVSFTGIIKEDNDNLSRAYWIHGGDGKPLFTWDDTENMKCVVFGADGNLKLFKDEKDENQIYSGVTVEPFQNDRLKATLTVDRELEEGFENGDIIFFCNPTASTSLNENGSIYIASFIAEDNDCIYNQEGLSSSKHLNKYVLLSGNGKINVTYDGVVSAEVDFKILPAIVRFKIMNNSSNPLTVNNVVMNVDGYNNKFEINLSSANEAPTYSDKNKNNNHTINCIGNNEISGNGYGFLYTLAFPTTPNSEKKDMTFTFSGSYNNKPFEISATQDFTQLFKNDDNIDGKLESNKYYTVELPISEDLIMTAE